MLSDEDNIDEDAEKANELPKKDEVHTGMTRMEEEKILNSKEGGNKCKTVRNK